MKNNNPTITAVNAETITSLSTNWFQLIEKLHHSITEKSALECATRCNARCCPKSRSSKRDNAAVGHVAIMLPFEREYILSKTNLNSEQLQHESIEFSPGVFIDIGFMNSSKPCPFLTNTNKCGIYDIRPLDCRSFPLIPFFYQDETITFRVDAECPSANTFSATYQTQLIKVWQDFLPNLPMSYRMLYNEL